LAVSLIKGDTECNERKRDLQEIRERGVTPQASRCARGLGMSPQQWHDNLSSRTI